MAGIDKCNYLMTGNHFCAETLTDQYVLPASPKVSVISGDDQSVHDLPESYCCLQKMNSMARQEHHEEGKKDFSMEKLIFTPSKKQIKFMSTFQTETLETPSQLLRVCDVCDVEQPIKTPPELKMLKKNVKFRANYPLVCAKMETDLKEFIEVSENDLRTHPNLESTARFISKQIVMLASSCLKDFSANRLTSLYFNELDDTLINLLVLIEEKEDHQIDQIVYLLSLCDWFSSLIERVRRLLECLERDPREYYKTGILGSGLPKRLSQHFAYKRIIKSLAAENNHAKTQPFFSPPSPPPKEEEFETIRFIEEGSFGSVSLVRHNRTNVMYAMKTILKSKQEPEFPDDPLAPKGQRKLVFDERDIMSFAATKSPFIVSLIYSFETPNKYCLVMELVEGGDFLSLLEDELRFSLPVVKTYLAEIISGIECLHSCGIVHRDLKPENLLLTRNGHIKITDFGMSLIGMMGNYKVDEFDGNRHMWGTPYYMSPEMVLGRPYGKSVDFWSFGVMAFLFLTGRLPFGFGTNCLKEIISSVVHAPINDLWQVNDVWRVEYPEDELLVSLEAQQFIGKLLQRDASKRLGADQGAKQIKEDVFFEDTKWEDLLDSKGAFIPNYFNFSSGQTHDDLSEIPFKNQKNHSTDEPPNFAGHHRGTNLSSKNRSMKQPLVLLSMASPSPSQSPSQQLNITTTRSKSNSILRRSRQKKLKAMQKEMKIANSDPGLYDYALFDESDSDSEEGKKDKENELKNKKSCKETTQGDCCSMRNVIGRLTRRLRNMLCDRKSINNQ